MANQEQLRSAAAEVKRAYSLEDYIGRTVKLTSSGPNLMKGLCPFHSEKTPSFTVNRAHQAYRCYGCGVHGDLISFVQETEHMGFMEALTSLAQDKGIVLDLDGKAANEPRIDYVSLRKCVKASAHFFVVKFREKVVAYERDGVMHPAVEQVVSRGLKVSRKTTKYGYAPDGNVLIDHLRQAGFSDDIIVQSGVAAKDDRGSIYSRFRHRLIFVLTDTQGRPIGFTGRKLSDSQGGGKYVNSPECPLFNKRDVLYNFSNASRAARKAGVLYVVEGQFDVRACVEAGIENAVAASGTAFTLQHGHKCRSAVGTNGRVVFVFDGDKAGRKAARSVLASIPDIQAYAYAVSMPDGQDPCDYRQAHGNEGLRRLLESNAVDLVEFVVAGIADNFDLDTHNGRTAYIEEVAPLIRSIKSRALRESQVRYVALRAQASFDAILDTVAKAKDLDFNAPQPASTSTDEEDLSPVDDVPDNEAESLNKVRQEAVWGAHAKLIKLATEQPSLIPRLHEVDAYVKQSPLGLMQQELFDLYEKHKHDDSIVFLPEDFSQQRLARFVFSIPDFAYGDSDCLKAEHFAFLLSFLVDKFNYANTKRIGRKIASTLVISDTSDQERELKDFLRAVDAYRENLAQAINN